MDAFQKHKLNAYTIMDASDEVLDTFFKDATRLDLIAWLSWNDRNGVYEDKQSTREFGRKMTRKQGIEIMRRQITVNR